MLKPTKNNIVVLPIKRSAVRKSGLYIPISSKTEVSNFGEVVAVGPEVLWVKPQKKIMYTYYRAPVYVDNKDEKEYVVINEDDILGELDEGVKVEEVVADHDPGVVVRSDGDTKVSEEGGKESV